MRSEISSTQGQAWDQIARAEYGTELRSGEVLAANADEADVLLLSGGLKIAVPPRPKMAQTVTIPPWQQESR